MTIRDISGDIIPYSTVTFVKFDQISQSWHQTSQEEAEAVSVDGKLYSISKKRPISGFPIAIIV